MDSIDYSKSEGITLTSSKLLDDVADTVSSNLRGAGKAFAQLGSDVSTIAGSGPAVASNLLIGAENELAEHPIRVASNVALSGMYALSISSAITALSMVPRFKGAVSAITALGGIATLGYFASEGANDMAHNAQLLNSSSGFLREQGALGLQRSGAELVHASAGLLGGFAGVKAMGSLGRYTSLNEIPETGVGRTDGIGWYAKNIPALSIASVEGVIDGKGWIH